MNETKIRIAVITANIGGIDEPLGIPKQTVDCDYFYYHENNLPFPLPNLNARLRSKYLKIQTHRFLPDYDVYIWIDGRVQITGINFVENFLEQLDMYSIAAYQHRERNSVYEEIEYILEQITKGNRYLLTRYGDQQMIKELLFYKDEGVPNDFPLFMSGIFARKNDKETNDMFDEWWRRVVEFSVFDQTMLSYALFKHELRFNLLSYDELRTHKLFTIGNHVEDKKK